MGPSEIQSLVIFHVFLPSCCCVLLPTTYLVAPKDPLILRASLCRSFQSMESLLGCEPRKCRPPLLPTRPIASLWKTFIFFVQKNLESKSWAQVSSLLFASMFGRAHYPTPPLLDLPAGVQQYPPYHSNFRKLISSSLHTSVEASLTKLGMSVRCQLITLYTWEWLDSQYISSYL